MINDKIDKLINNPINSKKCKKVHFSKLIRILLIPTSLEYFKAGIAHYIWSSPYDYIKYRRDSKLDDYKDKLTKTLDDANIAPSIGTSIATISN
jgi:hypothetical protein